MRKALIIGAGRTGRSVLRVLLEEGGWKVWVYDDSDEALEKLSSEAEGWSPVKKAEEVSKVAPDVVIPSPGVKPAHPALKKALESGAQLTTDIEMFEQRFSGKIVAVTGTNGKTTVATLTHEMLSRSGIKAFLGGNVGVPALEGLSERYDVAVLELSSFQLFYSGNLRVHGGILVNVDVDHLDWHSSLQEYQQAKVEWLSRVREKRIFNYDDLWVRERVFKGDGKDFPVSFRERIAQGGWIAGEKIFFRNEVRGGAVMFFPSSLPQFYALDLALAGSASFLYGADLKVVEEVALNFRPAQGRFQVVTRIGQVHVYDDSKATNPHAVKHALLSMKGKVVLMLGGVNKGLSFKDLKPLIDEKCCGVVFFGRDGLTLRDEINPSVPHEYRRNLREAVFCALSMAEEMGADILFSPGCASFDEFSGYLERSKKFREFVAEAGCERKGN